MSNIDMRERDLIRQKLTECHVDEYDYGHTEELQNPFRTEIRDNFVNVATKKPKCKLLRTISYYFGTYIRTI